MKEAAAASHIRLDAANINVHLWRNNVGVLIDETGRPVRYGLCNESKAENAVVKSADFIGITPVIITADMVGQTIGVFTAIETKKSDWKFYASDKRAVAQKAFHDIVLRLGGFAGFARNVTDFRRIIER